MSEHESESIITVELPVREMSKSEREYRAFLRLLPSLLPTYRGLHVAIHNGEVVDSDPDDVALILRVLEKVGRVPIHVGLVTEQQPLLSMPRYRECSAV